MVYFRLPVVLFVSFQVASLGLPPSAEQVQEMTGVRPLAHLVFRHRLFWPVPQLVLAKWPQGHLDNCSLGGVGHITGLVQFGVMCQLLFGREELELLQSDNIFTYRTAALFRCQLSGVIYSLSGVRCQGSYGSNQAGGYLFWGSKWFLPNKYAEGTNSKHLSGPLHLANLAKTPP